ncbi:lipase family protein [Gordonia sp. CPCC 205515]|uniref:lipase family protein n=1 Tax=Gordonia sp. CPCC 205515 TaxID=3140791 RepID=UPI003AF3CA2D
MRKALAVVVAALSTMTAAVSGMVASPAAAESSLQPGRVLGVTQLGEWGGLSGVIRLSYTTTDARGAVVPAAGIIRLPTGPRPAGGWRIVSWAHGTSGSGPDCGLTGSTDLIRGTAPMIDDLNRAGYAVVATDYIGLSSKSAEPHAYLQTQSEATAVIDMVRAARSMVAGLSKTWAVGGYSQGGQAALGAGQLARRYAPDLDFRGTAALAPVSNFESAITLLRPGFGGLPAELSAPFAAILAGMSTGQRDVDVSSYLSPLGKRIVDEIGRSCGPEWSSILNGVKPRELLSKSLDDSAFRDALHRYMGVPTSGYGGTPILVVHGVRDTTVPIPLTLALLREFRSAGTSYEFKMVNATHSDLRDKGGSRLAVDFLHRVMPAG